MRLVCPNCDAEYEVDDTAIPAEGRDVQCSNCTTTWFQPSAQAMHAAAAAPQEPPAASDDAETAAPAIAAAPRRPSVEPAAMDVIHEEVARETAAREAERGGIETQPDLGLDDTETEERATAARDRMARSRGLEPQPDTVEETGEEARDDTIGDAAAAAALAATPKRADTAKKELFPDIEEINSTLSPEAADAEAEAERLAASGVETPEQAAKSSFRIGFGLILLVIVGLLLLYVYAPQISASVPALAGLLDSYVSTVDTGRVALDGMVQGLVERIGTTLEDQPTAG